MGGSGWQLPVECLVLTVTMLTCSSVIDETFDVRLALAATRTIVLIVPIEPQRLIDVNRVLVALDKAKPSPLDTHNISKEYRTDITLRDISALRVLTKEQIWTKPAPRISIFFYINNV